MKLPTKIVLCFVTYICAVSAWNPVRAEVPEKLKPFHANFVAADKDRSGGLDADEFKVLIDANAKQDLGKAKKIQKRQAYDHAFKVMDKDKDKLVTWAEIESLQK